MGGGHAYAKPRKKQHHAHKQHHEAPAPKTQTEMRVDYDKGSSIVSAIQLILHHKPYLKEASPEFGPALALIDEGVNGKHRAAERIRFIDAGLAALEPSFAELEADPEGKRYLTEQALEPLTKFRDDKRKAIPSEQVDEATARIELRDPGVDDPRERGLVLRDAIRMLNADIEAVVRFQHHGIEHAAKELAKATSDATAKGLERWGVGTLADLQGPLMVVDALLGLSDDKLAEELLHPPSFLQGVAGYTELVGKLTELVGGATVALTSVTGYVADAIGRPALSAACKGFSRLKTLALADVMATIELVHGVLVLLESGPVSQEKLDAVGDLAISEAWLLGNPELASAILLAKLFLDLVSASVSGGVLGAEGIVMNGAFEMIRTHGNAILQDSEYVLRAEALMRGETDPDRAAGLKTAYASYVQRLHGDVTSLVADATARAGGAGNLPGDYHILVELFAPVAAISGGTTPDEVKAAAKLALDKVVYALQHQNDFTVAGARDMKLGEMEQELEDAEKAELERAQHDSDTAEMQRKMRENSQWDRHH